MEESNLIKLELTIREAKVIARALQGYLPPLDEQIISTVLYYKIFKMIEENA